MDAQHFRESICIGCPGTEWGKTSICKTHGMAIGHVEECDEWENGTTTVSKQRAADEIKERVTDAIEEYFFMAEEIKRLEIELGDVGSGLVAAYGDGAGMPKAKGSVSDVVHREVVRRERDRMKLASLRDKVRRIDQAYLKMTANEQAILDGMRDGVTLISTAEALKIHRATAHEIKKKVLAKVIKESQTETANDGAA